MTRKRKASRSGSARDADRAGRDLVVAGGDAGSKLKKAQEFGVRVVDEDGFRELLRGAVPDDSRMKTDFAVHLDGNKLQGEEAGAILGIRVFQTRSGASAFEIIVSDPELKWQGKPTFTDCKEVKIELGPTGKLKKVFDGEVTAWRTELERDGPTVLVLRGLDRSHRMMRAKKTKTYANASVTSRRRRTRRSVSVRSAR